GAKPQERLGVVLQLPELLFLRGSANTDEAVLTSLEPNTDVRSGVENADPEATGTGERCSYE
ncbi:MAG: hypothetical protein LUF91_03725, partial [Oscillospiraceae bacterium]|nr:hypothetical protein [Oscillospiraceae bacterium]